LDFAHITPSITAVALIQAPWRSAFTSPLTSKPSLRSVPSLPNNINICIFCPKSDSKPAEFRGSSLDDLRAFPTSARREAGHQLDQVQQGREPDDWKPMVTIGPGVREIRIRDASGGFRVIYLAKFTDAVYVLHCFQKKTQKTSKADLDLAAKRYRDLVKERTQ
jgi:phage-related protein